MRNFGELKNDVAILAQRSGDTDFIAKVGVWLNLGIEFLVDVYDYYVALKDYYYFPSADGVASYAMPNNFDKPLRVLDLTHKKTIPPISEEEYIDGNISSLASLTEGIPENYWLSGVAGTRISISMLGKKVEVKSSSLLDTSSPVIRINGYVDMAKLIEDFEDITVNPLAPTTYVVGTKTFYKITHVSKSADTIGYITVADEDGVVLDYLSSIDRTTVHKLMWLGLTPGAIYNYVVLFKKRPTRLVNDNDYPFIECDNFLTLDSWAWALSQSKESVEYAIAIWGKAEKALHAILTREAGAMGPEFQHKIVSSWLASHRQ